jgi:geranylgeranyl pyrophosphate synthase
MTPAFLEDARARVDAELARRLAGPADDPGRLWEAMRYAVLGGGKRIRPAVALAAAEAVGGGWEQALPAAAAVELLHAYTLVHDDLPAMDDDDMRRGKPTVHVAFGEAIAILVGDALLTEAFGALAALGTRCADAVAVLAERAGAPWLLAGQARDLAGGVATREELERMHAGKTGALFAAAAELGGIAAGAGAAARASLSRYGMALGIAFQHADDLADGDQPAFADEARRRLGELAAEARLALAPFGGAARPLVALVEWVVGSAR